VHLADDTDALFASKSLNNKNNISVQLDGISLGTAWRRLFSTTAFWRTVHKQY
jgi:hypothetical protein